MTIEEDDSSTELLLDPIVPSELQDDDDGVTLDEDFTELLLDPIVPSELQDDDDGVSLDEDFAELLLGTLDDDDFAFPLLDEVTSAGSVTLSLLEDDSTPGSSFGPVEDEESSPQAANNIAAAPIATRNFLI